MKCPFRIDIEFEYLSVPSTKKGDEPNVFEKAQHQVYPDCIEGDCPFFSYGQAWSSCERIRLTE